MTSEKGVMGLYLFLPVYLATNVVLIDLEI